MTKLKYDFLKSPALFAINHVKADLSMYSQKKNVFLQKENVFMQKENLI